MNRAYSLLTVKAVDEDQRIITGVATTPEPDRMGDVVEPLGVTFKNPMPLLHQHDSTMPVGTVKFDKPTKAGITFQARLPVKVDSEELQKRIDMAWAEVKAGLVRAVSIGFKALEYAFIEGGGIRFIESEVLELSLVSIPANAGATITSIKSIDTTIRAATGIKDGEGRPVPPGVTGKNKTHKPVNLKPKEGTKMNIKEQIAALEKKRDEHKARRLEIQQLAAKEGRTKNEEEKDEFANLGAELKSIEDELVDLSEMEAANLKTLKPALGSSVDDGSASRSNLQPAKSISVQRNLPKGMLFTRMAAAKICSRLDNMPVGQVAKSMFPDTPEVEVIAKAAVVSGNTTDPAWAGPLVQLNNATEEFLDLLRPATIIGRIPGFMTVPFNTQIPMATLDPTAYWVGEGQIKPVSAAAFDKVNLTFNKAAGIVVMTEELVRFSKPNADKLMQNALVKAVTYLTDRTFVDPTAAATGSSPASVTNGVSAISPSGTTADAFRDDLASMLAAYEDADMDVTDLVLVMRPSQAMRLGLMRNTIGVKEFPDIGRAGGVVEGVTVITSNNLPAAGGSPVDGYPIISLLPSQILLADEGNVTVDMSREASLVMDSAPDSPETSSTVMRNLWQHNELAVKAERFITWKKARSGVVQYIQGAKYA